MIHFVVGEKYCYSILLQRKLVSYLQGSKSVTYKNSDYRMKF